jgi:hypothetical protein
MEAFEDQPSEPQPPVAVYSVLTPSPSQSKKMRWIFFAAGFFGFYVVNGIAYVFSVILAIFLNQQFPNASFLATLLNLLCTVGNFVGVIVLSIIPKTRWIGFGILAAMAFSFALSILAGIVLTVVCFMILANPN